MKKPLESLYHLAIARMRTARVVQNRLETLPRFRGHHCASRKLCWCSVAERGRVLAFKVMPCDEGSSVNVIGNAAWEGLDSSGQFFNEPVQFFIRIIVNGDGAAFFSAAQRNPGAQFNS